MLLEKMIDDHENYFEESIARVIINKLSIDILCSKTEKILNNTEQSLETNIWGRICYRNINWESYDSTKSLDNANSYAYNKMIRFNEWKKLLNEKDINLVTAPLYTIRFSNNQFNTTINGVIAIKNMQEWFKNWEKSPLKYELNSEEKNMIAIDSMSGRPENYFFGQNMEKLNEYLINLLIEKKEYIKNNFKLSNEKLTVFFLNNPFIARQKNLSLDDKINLLITSDKASNLKSIFDNANQSKNIKSYPDMLSKVFDFASPEKWVEDCLDMKKSYPVLELFNERFFLGLGEKLVGVRNAPKTMYKSATREIIKMLEFFGSELAQKITDEEKFIWYAKIMKKQHKELFISSLDYFSFPEDTIKNKALYETLKTQKSENIVGSLFFEDIKKHWELNKLNQKLIQDLPVNNILVKKAKI